MFWCKLPLRNSSLFVCLLLLAPLVDISNTVIVCRRYVSFAKRSAYWTSLSNFEARFIRKNENLKSRAESVAQTTQKTNAAHQSKLSVWSIKCFIVRNEIKTTQASVNEEKEKRRRATSLRPHRRLRRSSTIGVAERGTAEVARRGAPHRLAREAARVAVEEASRASCKTRRSSSNALAYLHLRWRNAVEKAFQNVSRPLPIVVDTRSGPQKK